MTGPAIACRGLGRAYRVGTPPTLSLFGAMRERAHARLHWALRQVDLEVGSGEAVAVLGANGSGKSTLLRLVAGILRPSEGEVRVSGPVVPLFQWGLGFQGVLSGRENAAVYAGLLGADPAGVRKRMDEVARFAGIEAFLDAPVMQYSAGMVSRLAVATALSSMGEGILVLDEAFAVGDREFTSRCMESFAALRRRGRTFLLATHSAEVVRGFCSRAVVLRDGRVADTGTADEVADRYFGAPPAA